MDRTGARRNRHDLPFLLLILALLCLLSSAARAHDFGGPTGPGGPPPGDGCPNCCGGGGGGGDPCNPGGPGCGSSGNPVNFWDGSERHVITDVRVGGYVPIEFSRIYDSRVDYDSPVGYGWSHSYDIRLFKYPDGSVMLRRTCGSRGLFVPSGGGYISPPGEFRNTLVDNGDGTLTLIELSGMEYRFDLRGRLDQVRDVHGNRLELQYDPAGRRPLQGMTKFSPNPTALGTVALDYRLIKVRERDALGNLTGREINLSYDSVTGRLDTVTDFTGRSWSYDYDTKGNLTSVGGPLGLSYVYGYTDANDPHNMTSLDEGREAFSLTYDTQDRVTQQVLSTGTRWNIAYTVPGVRTTATQTVVDPNNVTLRTAQTIYDFNSFGNPTKITDALGNETTFTRDSEGNTQLREVRQNVPGTGLVLIKTIGLTYDAAGNILTETHTQHSTGEVVTKTFTYDHNMVATERVASTLSPGNVSGRDNTFGHNARGYPTVLMQEKRIVSGGATPTPTFHTVDHDYNPFGQLSGTTYSNGNTDTLAYTNGYLTTVGGQTLTRDPRGNILTRRDGNSNTWTYTYDALDRMLTAEDPALAKSLFTWGQEGTLDQMEIGRTAAAPGRITVNTYDTAGRPIKAERQTSTGLVTIATTVFDSEGNILRHTDGAGRFIRRTYDPLGRMITETDGANQTTNREFDVFGNLTKVTDPAGRVTKMTNWLAEQPGKPLAVTNGLNKTFTAVLDPLGNLRSLTDPLGLALNETHDGMGRLTSFAIGAGVPTVYTYAPRGGVATRTDAAGGLTTYTYNPRGILTGIDLPGPDSVTLTLDAGDRVTQAVDLDSDLTYTYDGLNRVTSETNNLTGRSTTMTWNSVGQRSSMVTTDGVTTTYDYNDLDHLIGIRRNGTLEVSYQRDLAGLVSQATYANGNVITYTRDGAGRLGIQETRDSSSTLINRVEYTRDLSGVITVKHEVIRRPDGSSSDLFFHYTIDDALRMTREEIRGSDDVTIMSARNFTYDDVGNRLTMAFDGGATTSYAYSTDYKLQSETTGGSSINYTYDPRGSIQTETFGGSTVTYGHDPESRMISLDSPTSVATYVLSWDGRRLAKVVNGSRTDYLYDGMNVVGEYPQGSPSISYLTGQALDQWILRAQSGQKSYYAQIEDIGSILQLTSAAGAVQDSYVYKAFGELIEAQVNVPNVNTFTGRNQDSESQHLYFRERLYSPRTGRFLSLDPFRPDASRSVKLGGSQRLANIAQGVQASPLFDQRRSVNVAGMDVAGYMYVGNNPVNGTDPTGEVLLWNPISGSVTSGCLGSGCLLTGCLGSGCGGSVCFGSGCGFSGCAVSACGGSGCAGSGCGGSLCVGSGCVFSGCFVSACGGSGCGGSACLVSVCGASACIDSVCYLSGCGGSVCHDSACGISACHSSGCGSSAGCTDSGCGGSICNSGSGCANSPCCP